LTEVGICPTIAAVSARPSTLSSGELEAPLLKWVLKWSPLRWAITGAAAAYGAVAILGTIWQVLVAVTGTQDQSLANLTKGNPLLSAGALLIYVLVGYIELVVILLVVRLIAENRLLTSRYGEVDPSRTLEHGAYEAALFEIASRSTIPLQHLSRKLRITVGSTAGEDRATDVYVTKSAASPVHWYPLAFGYGGAGVPAKASVRDLEDIDVALIKSDSTEVPLRYLPAGYGEGMVRAVVFFDHGISNQPLTWTVRYRWAGMCEPLRTIGSDDFYLDLLGGADVPPSILWKDVTVTFVFPKGGQASLFAPTSSEGIRELDADGHECRRFYFPDPDRAVYKWKLAMRQPS
jgi:hypothetical protein